MWEVVRKIFIVGSNELRWLSEHTDGMDFLLLHASFKKDFFFF